MAYLLQMAGFPGSGKTGLAELIAIETGAIVIDRDVIKNAMLGFGLEAKILAEVSYNITFELAKKYIDGGKSVIIDTPCFYKEIVERGVRLCDGTNAYYKYIECLVPSYEIVQNRLQSRQSLETQIQTTTEENYYRTFDKSVKPEHSIALTVDTSDFSKIDMDTIICYLNNEDKGFR